MEGAKLIKKNSQIHILNLNVNKRPISAVADNIEVRNAKTIKVKINKKLVLSCYTIKIIV